MRLLKLSIFIIVSVAFSSLAWTGFIILMGMYDIPLIWVIISTVVVVLTISMAIQKLSDRIL